MGKALLFPMVLLLLWSCAEQKKEIVQFDFEEDRPFTELLLTDNADKSHYVVFVLSRSGCDLCDYLKGKLSAFTGLPPNVLFRSVDVMHQDNLWLGQWLREASYPILLVMDTDNQLVAYVKGARLAVIKDGFQAAFNDRTFFDDGDTMFLQQYDLGKNAESEKIMLLNDVLQSYLVFSEREMLNQAELSTLRGTVDSYPYFFNTYLLYQISKDENLLRRLGGDFNADIDQFLYTVIKKELATEHADIFAVDGRAKLVLDQTSLHFGTGISGEVRRTSIVVRNTGDADLLPSDIVPSCNCVSVQWDKNPLKPGDQKEIDVSYELHNSGAYIQQLMFFSDVLEEPATFTIEGVVKTK